MHLALDDDRRDERFQVVIRNFSRQGFGREAPGHAGGSRERYRSVPERTIETPMFRMSRHPRSSGGETEACETTVSYTGAGTGIFRSDDVPQSGHGYRIRNGRTADAEIGKSTLCDRTFEEKNVYLSDFGIRF